MSKNTFALYFYINSSRPKRNGECPVNLRITMNGEVCVMSIKRSVHPELWEPETGMARGRTGDAELLNKYIDAVRVKAYQKHTELVHQHDVITPAMLRDAMLGINEAQTRTLVTIWEEHNQELKDLIGRETSYTNFQKYNTCLNYMKEFLEKEYRIPDIQVALVNRHLVTKFEHFIKIEKKCNFNTTIKYMQNFKKITRRAMNNGWLKQDPFTEIKLTLKEVERPYLSQEELNSLMERSFSIPRLRFVRDMFVLACFTGLSFIDMKQLRRSEVETGSNGTMWIRTFRQKTGVRSNIPLLNVALDIIQAYSNLSEMKPHEPLLPIISNQKMNAYLKEIADLCHIEKPLSFHIARHTFATTVTLMNGVPIESVSKMLGHKDIKTTQHYARIVDTKVGHDMEVLASRINPKMNLVVSR